MPSFASVADVVVDVEIFIVLTLAVAFVILYTGLFHWKKTKAGRGLLLLFVSWTIVLFQVPLLRILGPGYPGHDVVRILSWAFVLYSLINLLCALLTSLRRGKAPIRVEVRQPSDTLDFDTRSEHHG